MTLASIWLCFRFRALEVVPASAFFRFAATPLPDFAPLRVVVCPSPESTCPTVPLTPGSVGEVPGVAPFFLTGRGAGGGRKRLLHARSMFSTSFGEENSFDFWKQEGR